MAREDALSEGAGSTLSDAVGNIYDRMTLFLRARYSVVKALREGLHIYTPKRALTMWALIIDNMHEHKDAVFDED